MIKKNRKNPYHRPNLICALYNLLKEFEINKEYKNICPTNCPEVKKIHQIVKNKGKIRDRILN